VSSLSSLETHHHGETRRRRDPREATVSELLHRANQNDSGAWQVLMERFGRLVLHTARRLGLSHADAADAAQLTWLRLLEHGDQIRKPDRLSAWLTATARREALRVAMAGKRYELCADPTTEHGLERHCAVHDVYPVERGYDPVTERALARLPHRYQRLLRVLVSDSCPSYAEIARQLNLPTGSIGPMRMRALQMLRSTPEFADGWPALGDGQPEPARAA
jgi:RNA polymerase sigma factor (sigma-70 family)